MFNKSLLMGPLMVILKGQDHVLSEKKNDKVKCENPRNYIPSNYSYSTLLENIENSLNQESTNFFL